jgi:hypothetical protein
MKRAILTITIVLVAFSAPQSKKDPPSRGKDTKVYWYAPAGLTCPTYGFDPAKSDEEKTAKKSCESESKKPCTRRSGTASPAC